MFYKDISFFYVCKEFADFQKFLQKLCEDCLIIRKKMNNLAILTN